MRILLLLTIVLLSLSACTEREDTGVRLAGPLPALKADYQQQVVGQLSGEFTLANGDEIRSRWSEEERALARRYLKDLLAQSGIEPREQRYMAPNLNPAIDLLLGPFKGTNIYGTLPATEPSDEYIVLGAHYDIGKRNAPGAIDNATGIALIHSVAMELANLESRRKNILIVFFDQEEEELIGSRAFLNRMQQEEWTIHSVHCFDMVGWDGNGDRAMEIFSPSEALRTLYKETAARHGIPLREIVINPVGYDNSSTDFDAFVPAGYEVIGAGEMFYHRDSTPYKDSPDDTFDTVDFSYLLSSSDFIADVIKQLVMP